uniref:DUF4349 domain-containing protein n=1 Tax=Candidatus Limivicinus sp. TaxID=3030905 RepID=UPI003FEF4814
MKKRIALLLALLMTLSLCACGSSSKMASSTESAAYDSAPMEPPPNASRASGFAAMDSTASAGEYGEYDSGTEGGDVPDENPEKIIYSADATVETTEFDKTLEELAALIKEYGGWVQSSSINGANYYSISRGSSYNRSADYTIRIPSDKFQTVMGSLSTLGNVPYSYTYTENVSAQYYDVQSRLTAYKTQETRLLEMMEKAQTVEDTITIEEKLTELQYKIDSLQSSLNNWDRQVNYSTISLNVQEVGEYTEQQAVTISYGQRLLNAFTDSLKGAGRFFKNLLVFLVSALPTLVILAVLFFALRPLFRKLSAKAKARKEAKKSTVTNKNKAE